MMTSSIRFKTFAAIICSFIVATSAFANSWWARPYQGEKQDIVTLVVTSNVDVPRILADVILFDTKQPYILLPAKGQSKIFFCAARNKVALEIKDGDLTRFINFLNPNQVVVLGTPDFIGKKFAKMMPKTQTVMYVYNEDWSKTAKTLSIFFNKSDIYYDFVKLYKQFTAGKLYTPTVPKKVGATVIEDNTVINIEPGKSAAPAAAPAAPAEKETPAAAGKESAPALIEPDVKMPEASPVLVEEK